MMIVLRADANRQIGAGHLMRCLALAQAWQASGGSAHFVVVDITPALAERLTHEGMAMTRLEVAAGSEQDAGQTVALGQETGALWVVVDGYQFGAEYQQIIKSAGLKLLFVDDYGHAEHYYADMVLNQNIHAAEALYQYREPHTRLLLGTRYVLLRREFGRWRDWRREIPPVARKVLITLGGGDPDNVTQQVIRSLALVRVTDLKVVIVVGAGNPHLADLQAVVSKSDLNLRLEHNVSDMPALMAWADTAVSAAGSTCWELAFMGMPMLVLVLAENQRQVAAGLQDAQAVVSLGWFHQLSPALLAEPLTTMLMDSGWRRQVSDAGRQLVDGRGANRILETMFPEADGLSTGLRMRLATQDDGAFLWYLANESAVRANSFTPEPIPFKDHLRWLDHKLSSLDCRIWIAEQGSKPIGQMRVDRIDAASSEVHFAITANFRGQGVGKKMLCLTTDLACQDLGVERIRGIVLAENLASCRAFVGAGFTRVASNVRIHGRNCLVFEWRCRKDKAASDYNLNGCYYQRQESRVGRFLY